RGNGNDGTLLNMSNSNWVPGLNNSGTALQLNGTNQYISTESQTFTDITASMWIYPYDTPPANNTRQFFFAHPSYGGGLSGYLRLGSGEDNQRFAVGYNSSFAGSGDLVANKWYHITLQADSSTNTIQI